MKKAEEAFELFLSFLPVVACIPSLKLEINTDRTHKLKFPPKTAELKFPPKIAAHMFS